MHERQCRTVTACFQSSIPHSVFLLAKSRIPTMSIRYLRESTAGAEDDRDPVVRRRTRGRQPGTGGRDPAGDPALGGAAVPPPAADGDRVRGRGLLHHPHARRDRAARSRSSTSRPATSSPRRWNCASGSRTRYGIEVEYVRPELTVAEYEAEHGGPLYGHPARTSAATTARSCRCGRRWSGYDPGLDQRHPQGPDRPTAARPAWSSGTRSSTW